MAAGRTTSVTESGDDPSALVTHTGGCHCGAVRFEVEVAARKGLRCSCSICRKKGYLHLIVPESRFRLLQGESQLVSYRFNTETAEHLFCRTCGIHAFYRPRSHPGGIDVNIRCLDGYPVDQFEIDDFDGARWEDNVANIRERYS